MSATETKTTRPSRYAALDPMDTQAFATTTTTRSSQTPSITTNITSISNDTTLINTITNSSTAFSTENIYLPTAHYKFTPKSFLPSLLAELNITQQRIYSAALRRRNTLEADVDIHALYAVAREQKRSLTNRIRLEAFRAQMALKVRKAIANRDSRENTCIPAGIRGAEYQVAKFVLRSRVRKAEMEVEDLWECVKSGMHIWKNAEEVTYYWG